MLIYIPILVLLFLSIFNLIIGNNFLAQSVNLEVENIAIIDGDTTTLLIEGQSVVFQIDTSSLITAGISLLITVTIIATIFGVSVLGSGLNPEASKIIILITAYSGVWSTLSFLCFSLIIEIAIFGSVIYIGLTVSYAIGIIDKLSD